MKKEIYAFCNYCVLKERTIVVKPVVMSRYIIVPAGHYCSHHVELLHTEHNELYL